MAFAGSYIRCGVVGQDPETGRLVVVTHYDQIGSANPSRYGLPEKGARIRVLVQEATGSGHPEYDFFGQALPRKRDLRNGTGV